MKNSLLYSRRGSIYLITLITVAAIVSMILIGVRLRSATSTQSTVVEKMAEGSSGVLSAAEYAIETIAADNDWGKSAKSGIVYNEVTVGDSTFSATVIDADTSEIPEDDTSVYRVIVKSHSQVVSAAARFDVIDSSVDYVSVLKALGAKHYWALNEPTKSKEAVDSIGEYKGDYKIASTSGVGTNNEGALVPVFVDVNDQIEVPWGNDFKSNFGSISLWLRCTGSTKSENYSFIGMDYTLDGVPALNMSIYNYGVTAYLDDDNSWGIENFTMTSNNLISPDVWYHVVMTWGNDGLVIYVDGVEQANKASNTDGLWTKNGKRGGEQPLRLGGGFDIRTEPTPDDGFEGSIAHVAFFPTQLTAQEVSDLAGVVPDFEGISLVENSWLRVFE